MLQYKIDIMAALKAAGVTFASCRKSHLFSQATLTRFKRGDASIDAATLDRLCCVLEMQPRDLLRYVEGPEDAALYREVHEQKK